MFGNCVPSVYVRGKKKGQVITCIRHRGRTAREELIKRDGPPPFPDAICRHLCENDSTARNGFVCTLHTVWGTHSENVADQGRKVKVKAGKISQSIVRTCPHCNKTMKGAIYFRYHGERCKLAPPPGITSTK
jgi:hypothetical protein